MPIEVRKEILRLGHETWIPDSVQRTLKLYNPGLSASVTFLCSGESRHKLSTLVQPSDYVEQASN